MNIDNVTAWGKKYPKLRPFRLFFFSVFFSGKTFVSFIIFMRWNDRNFKIEIGDIKKKIFSEIIFNYFEVMYDKNGNKYNPKFIRHDIIYCIVLKPIQFVWIKKI